MDKKKKDFYLNLLTFIGMPIVSIAGVLMMGFYEYNTLGTLGAFLFFIGAFVFMFRLLIAVAHFTNKKKRQKENIARWEKENIIDEARQEFRHKTDYPQTNTLKLVNEGVVFDAKGRYVCEKDFKNISGNHLAFEITATKLKSKPKDYEDVCDSEGTGVLVSVGYHDGEALEKYANDNGVILKDTPENSVDKTITLTSDSGYVANVWTAEGDDVDYGFVKILKYENDILTVHFLLKVPYGLCDTVEGVVELKKDAGGQAHDIDYLIGRIKRKQYNTIAVSDEEVESIKQANPFLPESYIQFLSEVGRADLDWIDIGLNEQAPIYSDGDQTESAKDIIKDYKDRNADYYFIGIDNDGTYYAFSGNPDDKKVYFFSEDASDVGTFETFEEFLSEILSA